MMTTPTTETIDVPSVDNGIDLDALLEAREALTADPAAAAFVWTATCEWVNGTHSRTTIEPYYGLGEHHQHRQAFVIDGDHPQTFASEDNGATPTEIALAALAGCLTAGVASVATRRGIQLRRVTAVVEGDLDARGVIGADPDVRNGFGGIRVRFDIDADASRDELAAVVSQSQKRSAVYDALTNPTAVTVGLA
ncbi:MAG: OsmC family protein [Actinomycetota bacterium]